MKKLILTLAVAAIAVLSAYAEEKNGVVVSTENNQLLVDESGTQVTFVIKEDAKISDAEGNVVELSTLATGSKVKVEFAVNTEGVNEASAVTALKE